MRKILLSMIAIILAISCSKNFEAADDESIDTFEAVFEESDSKVILSSDNKTLHWENGDKIYVNGKELTAEVGDDKTKATFSGDKVKFANAYQAIYPSSDSNCILPTSFEYQAGKFSHIPMIARNTTKNLTFKNVFAVLKISVSSSVTVKSIKVSSDNQINGKFSFDDNFKATMYEETESNKTTTLNCNNVAGTDFFIPIPAGTYAGTNLKVTLTKSDESVETMTSKQELTLVRNTIYSVNFRNN